MYCVSPPNARGKCAAGRRVHVVPQGRAGETRFETAFKSMDALRPAQRVGVVVQRRLLADIAVEQIAGFGLKVRLSAAEANRRAPALAELQAQLRNDRESLNLGTNARASSIRFANP